MSEDYNPMNIQPGEVNDKVLSVINRPSRFYFYVLLILGGGIGAALISWIIQVRNGMGVSGLNHPVGWGAYITNFVFWVGIGHSGTFISAILFLVRAKFRDAVSRSAEAMTVFAVMTAGLFPLIHLGRLWVFYYILPYPSERQIWPNFKSPLVWDLLAVITYMSVTVIFFYVGLIPDTAAARDRSALVKGTRHIKTKAFRALSLGWSGTIDQWRHYDRAYLYFAALATPLVISVHSIVSWDFAVGILPGWHTTIFAPYFVAGAIHSGLAMVLTLLIPMRTILNLEKLITVEHLEMIAKTIIVTALIVGYSYIVEPLIGLYSGDKFEIQFIHWRLTGTLAWIYWLLIPFNFLIPLLFVLKKVRKNLLYLFVISLVINIGMWLERYFLVTGSTAHDFMPHAWGDYSLSLVEIFITAGSFAFFFFGFLLFSKLLPVIPIADFKKQLTEEKQGKDEQQVDIRNVSSDNNSPAFLAMFSSADSLVRCAKLLVSKGYKKFEVFSPVKIKELDEVLGIKKSPVRIWTLAGAIFGFAFGYFLAGAASLRNDLIVHGKPPVSLIPYFLIAFEFMVLIGAISNFAGLIIHTKLFKRKIPKSYDYNFSNNKYGLEIDVDEYNRETIRKMLEEFREAKNEAEGGV